MASRVTCLPPGALRRYGGPFAGGHSEPLEPAAVPGNRARRRRRQASPPLTTADHLLVDADGGRFCV